MSGCSTKKSGATVDASENTTRITPLMAAMMHAETTPAAVLLDAGASVERRDRRGNNALSYALEWQRPALAELLRARGAIPQESSKLPPEADELRQEFVAIANADAAIVPLDQVDLPPAATHTPSFVVKEDFGSFQGQAVYSTIPVARPLEPGSPIVMTQRVDWIPGGFSALQRPSFWALVSLVVETDGTPSGVACLDASSRADRDEVCNAVNRYRFLPGEKGGAAVRTWMLLPVLAKP